MMTLEPVADLVTLGETMGLLYPEDVGPLEHASHLRLAIGGAESNVAIAAARLGTRTAWIGRVGADPVGRRIARELRAEGVHAVVVEGDAAPTGLMMKERRTPSVQRVQYYRAGSAGSRLSLEDLPPLLIERARILHVTGITAALSPGALDAVRSGIQIARASGVSVSFDVNHRSRLWSSAEAVPVYRELVQQADIVFAGEDEAAMVVGPGRPQELATRIGELGPRQVVIKQGADGATAWAAGSLLHVDAVPVDVVDTVGAGDGFVGGYLSELVAGAGHAQALATAAQVGAFACQVRGDWEGMPTRDDLALLDAADPVLR